MAAPAVPSGPGGAASAGDAARTAEAVARQSYGRLVALLARRDRDIAAAEDALSEAFAAALRDWPVAGCPANPEAWLLIAARRRFADAARRRATGSGAVETLLLLAEEAAEAAAGGLPDHRLALMFAAAHPAIDEGIRAPLILQAVLGFDAAAIACAFLVSPAAMGKRLGRAKDKIRRAGIPFRIPERDELAGRLGAVLGAVYAAFASGWSDPGGADPARRDLGAEGLYLARLLVDLLPEEPETLGLLAMMLHAEARRAARRAADGAYVPLAHQETALWDRPMIAAAEALLLRAAGFGRAGRYQLEAALQSAHVHRRLGGGADWREVLKLYDGLLALSGSPVVALNRALVIAELDGPAAGFAAAEAAAADGRLDRYQPYWAARADLLARLGAATEARAAYELAIGLEPDPAVRRFLQQRQAALG